MLLENFYTIKHIKHNDNTIDAAIKLNIEHPVYEGHFPQKPVVPGVCMLEIIKQLLSQALNKKCTMIGAKNIKFTAMLDPTITDVLKVTIIITEQNPDEFEVSSTISSDDTIFLKYKGTFNEVF